MSEKHEKIKEQTKERKKAARSAATVFTDVVATASEPGPASFGVMAYRGVKGYVYDPLVEWVHAYKVESWRVEKLHQDLGDTKLGTGRPDDVIAAEVEKLEPLLKKMNPGEPGREGRTANQPSRGGTRSRNRRKRVTPPYDTVALDPAIDNEAVIAQIVELMYACKMRKVVLSSLPGYCGWRVAGDLAGKWLTDACDFCEIIIDDSSDNGLEQREFMTRPDSMVSGGLVSLPTYMATGDGYGLRHGYHVSRPAGTLLLPILVKGRMPDSGEVRIVALENTGAHLVATRYSEDHSKIKAHIVGPESAQAPFPLNEGDHVVMASTQAMYAERIGKLTPATQKPHEELLVFAWRRRYWSNNTFKELRRNIEQLLFNAWRMAREDTDALDAFKNNEAHSKRFQEVAMPVFG